MDLPPPPHKALAEAERSIELVRAYYEQAGDQASLFAAGADRWQLVGLLTRIAAALEAIADWEPRDFEHYTALESVDMQHLPDLYEGIA